jgi:hypothetical protein
VSVRPNRLRRLRHEPSQHTAPKNSAKDAPAATLPNATTATTVPPLVGIDDAPGKRERLPTAVILFSKGSTDAETLRFVPVVCVIDGRLETGKACGLVMPQTARVRMTRSAANAPAIATITRSTRDFFDDAGGRNYVAPTGPACCMYNTCVDETIPYMENGNVAIPSRVLAIWPENADIQLKPQSPGSHGIEMIDGPWVGQSGVQVAQALRIGGQRLVSTRGPCGSCGSLWVDRGGGFASVGDLGGGADGFDILATSDIDGDGHSEVIVYEVWRNDYGLHVLGNDWSKPAYRFNCGNI